MSELFMKKSKVNIFRAFYWCKQCHEDILDVTLIKKCKCRNRKHFKFYPLN